MAVRQSPTVDPFASQPTDSSHRRGLTTPRGKNFTWWSPGRPARSCSLRVSRTGPPTRRRVTRRSCLSLNHISRDNCCGGFLRYRNPLRSVSCNLSWEVSVNSPAVEDSRSPFLRRLVICKIDVSAYRRCFIDRVSWHRRCFPSCTAMTSCHSIKWLGLDAPQAARLLP